MESNIKLPKAITNLFTHAVLYKQPTHTMYQLLHIGDDYVGKDGKAIGFVSRSTIEFTWYWIINNYIHSNFDVPPDAVKVRDFVDLEVFVAEHHAASESVLEMKARSRLKTLDRVISSSITYMPRVYHKGESK